MSSKWPPGASTPEGLPTTWQEVNGVTDRTCTVCAVSKPLEDFPRDANATQGRRANCKACHAAKSKRRYAADPSVRERYVAARKSRALADPDAARAYVREQYERHREKRLTRQWAHTQARRARAAGVVMDDDLSMQGLRDRDGDECHYCGVVLDFEPNVGKAYKPDLATVDHVHPISRGGSHTWDNVVLACWACNTSKKDRTVEEWLGR